MTLDKECLQANTEALTALEKRLQVVQQILDEVANELGWLTRNLQDLSIGGEGPSRDESVRCMECEAEPIRTLAEALRLGWSELMLHKEKYVGMCPDCLTQEDEQIESTRRPANGAARQEADAVEDGILIRKDFPLDDALEMGLTAADIRQAISEGVTTMLGLRRIEKNNRGQAAVNPSENVPTPKPVAPEEPREHVPTAESVASDEPIEETSTVSTHSPVQSENEREKSHSKSPLYIRMFMQAHLTALVRSVGYDGFPHAEGQERMRPLIEKFGETAMRAAIEELVEIDNTQDPPRARLSAQARKLAIGLLGRPPDAPPIPPHVPLPSSAPEPTAQADATAPASIKLPRKRKEQSTASRSRPRRRSKDTSDS